MHVSGSLQFRITSPLGSRCQYEFYRVQSLYWQSINITPFSLSFPCPAFSSRVYWPRNPPAAAATAASAATASATTMRHDDVTWSELRCSILHVLSILAACASIAAGIVQTITKFHHYPAPSALVNGVVLMDAAATNSKNDKTRFILRDMRQQLVMHSRLHLCRPWTTRNSKLVCTNVDWHYIGYTCVIVTLQNSSKWLINSIDKLKLATNLTDFDYFAVL